MAEIERRQLLTPTQVAKRLGVKPKTLSNWRYRGFGPQGFRVGQLVRYWDDEVEQWLLEQWTAQVQN